MDSPQKIRKWTAKSMTQFESEVKRRKRSKKQSTFCRKKRRRTATMTEILSIYSMQGKD